MNKASQLKSEQSGIVFITVLFVGLLLTFIGLSMANVTIVQLNRSNDNVYISNALLAAEAGIEQTLAEINNNESFPGYASETDFYDNDVQGRGTYQTTITAGTGPNERVITSIGRAYRTTDVMVKERRVRVTIVSTSSPGYSVQTGPGGLILSGSAAITNSKVYVNGFIQLNGASSIGTAGNPLDVFVANANCPTGSNPGPTYPQVCTSGEPISFATSTHLYGNVCATGQTSIRVAPWQTTPVIQDLISGCIAPTVPMPTYNRAAHIASTTSTVSATDINYNCSQWQNPNGFVRTMPANVRINGNANWSSSCDLTITGNVYITGDLTMGGSATIRVADSLGTTKPVILVDGSITAGGSSKVIPNSSGTGAHFISFEGSGSCNLASACSGTDLKTSQGVRTVDVAGAGNFPGTIFHSYWGTVRIGGSGTMGSAIGQTIDMSGAGNVVFGLSLASGEATWTIRSYQYDYE